MQHRYSPRGIRRPRWWSSVPCLSLSPFLATRASEDRPFDDLHPIFQAVPPKRMGEVLKQYKLT